MERYGRYGRPLGKHHATDSREEGGERVDPDPCVTRDENAGPLDVRLPGDPDSGAGVADPEAGHLKHDRLQHYMMDMEAMDARVVPSRFGPDGIRRLPRLNGQRILEAFLRGFFMALGIMLGAGAGVIISGVLVLALLALFGQGQ